MLLTVTRIAGPGRKVYFTVETITPMGRVLRGVSNRKVAERDYLIGAVLEHDRETLAAAAAALPIGDSTRFMLL